MALCGGCVSIVYDGWVLMEVENEGTLGEQGNVQPTSSKSCRNA